MQVTGKVVGVYPEVTGTYLGVAFRHLNAIIVSDNCIDGTNIHDRYVVKFKNNNIDVAKSSGCLEGSDSFTFTLLADAIECRRNDGASYPMPKPMVCVGVKPLLG